MKIFLLAMMLFIISSNAIAKVEIWLCNSKYGIDVFKIDTLEPLNTSQRINKHWRKFLIPNKKSEAEYVIYDSHNQEVKIIFDIEKEKKSMIFDLKARELIIKFHDNNKNNSKWSCELK